MAKRRPKIAFMMFQDVIMAVFGVLILIVIYLLLNAKISDIEFVDSLNELQSQKANLGAAVDQSKDELAAMNLVVASISKQRLNAETSKQKHTLESQIAELKVSIAELKGTLVESKAQRDVTFERNSGAHPEAVRIQERVVEEDRRLKKLTQQLKDLDREITATRNQLKQAQDYLEDLKSKIRIELDEDLHGKNVYLLDLSATGIDGVMIGEQGEVTVAANSIESIKAILDSDTKRKQVYFFVRPDGIKRFRELQVSLRKKGVAIGYQPIAEGEKLVLSQIPPAPAPSSEPVGGQSDISSSGTGGGSTTESAGNRARPASGDDSASSTKTDDSAPGDGAAAARTSGDSAEQEDSSAAEDLARDNADSSESDAEQEQGGDEDVVADDENAWDRYLFWLLVIIALALLVFFWRKR